MDILTSMPNFKLFVTIFFLLIISQLESLDYGNLTVKLLD